MGAHDRVCDRALVRNYTHTYDETIENKKRKKKKEDPPLFLVKKIEHEDDT